MSASMRVEAGLDLGRPYDPIARTFHWLIAALLVMQVVIALVLPAILPESAEDALTAWHVSVGPTILLVMVLRLAWRLTHTPPPPPADLSPKLHLIAEATHWAFYAILIVLPVLGWTAASAYGVTPRLFGLIPLPALVAQSKPFAEAVGRVHITVAFILLALIALHIAGALYHALIRRDRVIYRMLPK